jgi:hypothetical protein
LRNTPLTTPGVMFASIKAIWPCRQLRHRSRVAMLGHRQSQLPDSLQAGQPPTPSSKSAGGGHAKSRAEAHALREVGGRRRAGGGKWGGERPRARGRARKPLIWWSLRSGGIAGGFVHLIIIRYSLAGQDTRPSPRATRVRIPATELLLINCGLAVEQQCSAVANRSFPILDRPASRQPHRASPRGGGVASRAEAGTPWEILEDRHCGLITLRGNKKESETRRLSPGSSSRCEHQIENEGKEIRTPNLLIWSQTRCRCAIRP